MDARLQGYLNGVLLLLSALVGGVYAPAVASGTGVVPAALAIALVAFAVALLFVRWTVAGPRGEQDRFEEPE